jgi:hypothetical protein
MMQEEGPIGILNILKIGAKMIVSLESGQESKQALPMVMNMSWK